MSLITYDGLVELVDQGVVTGVEPEQINGASIDVRLGPTIWIEDARGGVVDLAAKESPTLRLYDLSCGAYALRPGEFILAQTREQFNLPTDVAFEFKLKSSLARSGLGHLLAGHADPAWHGSVLTLEYQNCLQHHTLLIRNGMKAGQIVFHRGEPVPDEHSYAARGQYNQCAASTPSRGLR